MNKPLAAGLGVVALGVAAYVGASAWSGQQIQSRYEAQLEKLPTQLPFIKVVDRRYEKGLWSSTSTVTMQFGCLPPAGEDGEQGEAAAAEPPRPLLVTWRDTIQHGPLPGGKGLGAAAIDTELVLSDEVRQQLAKVFGDARPLTIRTLVGFDGRYASTIESPAVQFSEETRKLAWQGLKAHIRSDAAGSFADYELEMPGLEITDGESGSIVRIGRMTAKGSGQSLGGSWWVMTGKGEGEIASMEVNATPPAEEGEPPAKPFKLLLTGLKVSSDTTAEGELLSSVTRLSGAGMVGDTRLDRVEMQASMKRMHAPSYQRLMAGLLESTSSCDPAAREADAGRLLAGLQAELANLLPHNPEYGLDKLAVEVGGKRGELSYAFGVQGVTPDDLKLPPQALLMTRGVLRADVKLPVAWIELLSAGMADRAGDAVPPPEMVNVMLDQFAAQGFLVRDGELVSSSVRYGGQSGLLVNGKPLALGRPPAQ